MRYAFVLGRVYTLSIAELVAILEQSNAALGLSGEPIKLLEASPEVVIIETVNPLPVDKLQKRLGGVIKILEVVDIVKKRALDSINFALKHYFKPSILKKQFLKDYKGKGQFGVSIYLLDMELARPPQRYNPDEKSAPSAFGEPKRLGMMIKNVLTEGGQSVRLVLPEFNALALASVVVTKNLLLQKGAEICVLAGKDTIYTAKTLVVQDFEDYGRRDYQRPVRDEKQGMIPPKVAQVMLNLARADNGQTVLDPFCGIGTIIQEGLLLGFRMIGSDINKSAIHGSETNLEWFRNRYKIAPGKYNVEVADATNLAHLMASQKVAAVVTEGTLGPVYGNYPKPADIAKNFTSLTQLYTKTFTEFSKFLPAKARVVICIPAYKKTRDDYEQLESLDFITALGYNLVDIITPALAKKLKFLRLTDRGTAIYDRKDQIVAREIVVFEKL
jgi:tRNA G10  N-methylase Trm11